ncbi:MAG TPA: Hsp20/alpha crystallin family protein [Methanosarcinaceae archaeon]|nr:Hsp20/alpha crystallin family protein [Methanosarcinaceae archaeon]
MADERRKRNLFDNFFGADSYEDIEGMIDYIFNEMGINMDELSNQPLVYGFSVTRHPGEEPEIHEFGNVPPEMMSGKREEYKIHIGERKPLVDVLETDEHVHVAAEMPDIEKEDIHLDATDLTVELKAIHGERKYFEHIELPVRIDPNSAKATYKNGVLEVIFKRQETERKTSIEIE